MNERNYTIVNVDRVAVRSQDGTLFEVRPSGGVAVTTSDGWNDLARWHDFQEMFEDTLDALERRRRADKEMWRADEALEELVSAIEIRELLGR